MLTRVAHYITGFPASIFISHPIRIPRLALPALHWLDKHTSMMPRVGAMRSQIALPRCPSTVDVSGDPSGLQASQHVAVKLSYGVRDVVC
ncbi:hypothetical protein BD309DRAFT_986583 [Dichomitus squalens]|uniref:Uncharacterized protein n=1 Tax=Dichomitus squalens TaxID=114155 RepID=A0A4Q9P8Z2_9APHY|nr:hypothetical protein BD309DRAFT_986583 [Dichomitus squalens]TBU62606.1 hypothetical protein BD310DRAFT_945862 [Dichomitus squalens]